VRDSLAKETELFLLSQLREDRDPIELWSANYTYFYINLQVAASKASFPPTGWRIEYNAMRSTTAPAQYVHLEDDTQAKKGFVRQGIANGLCRIARNNQARLDADVRGRQQQSGDNERPA